MVEKKENINAPEQVEAEIDSESDDGLNPYLVKCRFYRNEVPEEGDLVMVVIKKMEQAGAYVHLPEYNDLEAFLMFSDVSKQRIKSVRKFIQEGSKEIMEVKRVDVKSKSVDVTRKTVKPHEAKEHKGKYILSKKVHNIMKSTAVALKIPVIDLYEEWGWDLYDNFEHAYDAFRIILAEPEVVFSKIDIPEDHQEALKQLIIKYIGIKPKKIRADFSATCTSFEGVELIKEAMGKAKHAVCCKDWNIVFSYEAAPIYKVEVMTHKRQDGIKKLEEAMEIISTHLRENKQKFF